MKVIRDSGTLWSMVFHLLGRCSKVWIKLLVDFKGLTTLLII